jgi:enoyl-CoA hydratase/carnithine racemase
LRLHTEGKEHVYTGQSQHDLGLAFADIAADHENRIVVLTGTGSTFIADIDGPSLGDVGAPQAWDRIYSDGKRLLQNLLDIEARVIGA